jgi:hypothetical protein
VDDVIGAEVAESPSADVQPTESTPPGAQAGANGQPNAQPVVKDPPFHQHPRFQQLIGENRSLKGELAKLQQTVAGLERTASQPARTEEQRQVRAEAIKQLKELFAEDEELRDLLAIRKEFPNIKQGYQGVTELANAQQQQQVRQAISHINQLADKANLDKSPKFRERLTRLVAAEARTIADGAQRVDRGDFAVFDEAFKSVQDEFLGQLKREAAGSVLQTKNAVQGLPPRSGAGGTAGREAAPTLKPGEDPKAFRRSMFARGRAALAESTEG